MTSIGLLENPILFHLGNFNHKEMHVIDIVLL